MFNTMAPVFYTPYMIQVILVSFVLVSVFFVIILLNYIYIPHFCFLEILNFRYPKFYKFLFGKQSCNLTNNNNEDKYIYFKINVLLGSAFARYIFLTFLYHFALSHNITNSLLTPFSIVMSVFWAFIFEATIIQFFAYLGVEFFIEFTFSFRFIMEHLITKSNGVVYSMLTLMRDLNLSSSNGFKQRNNISSPAIRSSFNKGSKLTISYPRSYDLIFGPRFGSIDWSNRNSVKSFLKDPYYLIHRKQKEFPIIFKFADFKLPKFSDSVASKIGNLIVANNLLINIVGYIEIGIRNPGDFDIFKKDLGAQNFIDSGLKEIDKSLSVFDFINFIEDILNKTSNYEFKTEVQYLDFIKFSLAEHFPKIFSDGNWASKNSRDFLNLVHTEVQKLADQSCVLTVFDKIYSASKVMPVLDKVAGKMSVSRNINLYEGKTGGVFSSIGDFIICHPDGRTELIESKFRSAKRANKFRINLGPSFLDNKNRSVTFLKLCT